MTRHVLPLAAFATLAWLAALAATPVLRAAGAPAMRAAAGVFHASCGRICHQRPERSFAASGHAWPVCGRCAGLYAGAAAGAWMAWLGARRRPAVDDGRRWRTLLVAAAIPTAVTWALEAAGLVAFSTATRFAAALPLGALAAWVVARALAAEAPGVVRRGAAATLSR